MNQFIEFLKGLAYVSKSKIRKRISYKNIELDDTRIAKIVEEIETRGLCIIEDYYSAADCEKAIAEIDKSLINYKDKVWVDDQEADYRLFGIDRISEPINHFFQDAFISKVLYGYLKTKVKVEGFTLAGRIRAVEKNLGSGGGWHRDIIYDKQFKAIVYLTDTSRSNGPFEYLENTHRHSVIIDSILNNNIGAGQSRFSEKNIEDIKHSGKFEDCVVTGKAGTLILVDTSGIHRGMPIQEGMRYALTNYYFEEPIPEIFNLVK
ncbi:MAG: hypothetical protein JWM14_1416 [Chitinophagaceae bacterium]|nr:hypothetical protein [Chitinophagaceae bacterium]